MVIEVNCAYRPVQVMSPTVTLKVKVGTCIWTSDLSHSYTGMFLVFMPYSCNTWIGVFPGLAVIIFPKLQKPEKGVLCMPKQAGKQKHAEASFDCHQAPWRPGPMLARRTISRTRSSGHRAEAGRAREVFREIIQGQWNRSAATTRDYAHKSQTTRGCDSPWN